MKYIAAAVAVIASSAALAHQGVTNPVVLERMQLMTDAEVHVKALGAMLNGTAAFDTGAAGAAKQALLAHAQGIAPAFAAQETDPRSDALPSIWSDPDGFASAAARLERAVSAMETATPELMKPGFTSVAQACVGCHRVYSK